jgi:dihydrofolate synthase/folylpolyglutamate synthase
MGIDAAYQSTLTYLYDRLPLFSKEGKAAIKPGLDNVIALCKGLGDPQDKFKSIHIAGTNGKGSTSHMLSGILQDAGYKTGLYTSPHLVDFRERILVNGIPVSKEWVVDFAEKLKPAIESIKPSFFEVAVAMAFQAFVEQGVDIAVIETGLGGRLDSTNIITPILSIITNIGFDHKDVLGHTLKEIATEKSGIIKQGVPVLLGQQDDETSAVFFEKAIHSQSTIYYAQALWDLVRVRQDAHFQYFKAVHQSHREMYDLHTDLLGSYQQHNIKTVLAATEILIANQGLHLSIPATISVLSRIKKLSRLRGRWERISESPLIITDVAHNPAGLKEVMQQWNELEAAAKHVVVGFVKDKEVREALALFLKGAVYHFCAANTPRALPAKELEAIANELSLTGSSYGSVAEAVQSAKASLKARDALLITGSFFVVGEAMEFLASKQAVASQADVS